MKVIFVLRLILEPRSSRLFLIFLSGEQEEPSFRGLSSPFAPHHLLLDNSKPEAYPFG